MTQAPAPAEPSPRIRPRRGRRLARTVSVFLAAGAVLGAGAAAYSRGVNPLAAGRPLPAANALRTPAIESSAASGAPAPGGRSEVRGAKNPAKVVIGDLRLTYETSGLAQASLPITVTNTGSVTRSFDVTVLARNSDGSELTSDTGTAADLRPGQTAQVRVLEIVNAKLVEALQKAIFEIEEIFTY